MQVFYVVIIQAYKNLIKLDLSVADELMCIIMIHEMTHNNNVIKYITLILFMNFVINIANSIEFRGVEKLETD